MQVIPNVLKDHRTFRVKESKKNGAVLEDQPIEQLMARPFFLDCLTFEDEGAMTLQNIHSYIVLNNLIPSNRVCWVCWSHGQRS